MTPIEPTQELSGTLQAQQWNIVLDVLSRSTVQPYAVIAPIIQSLSRQLHETMESNPHKLQAVGEK